MKYIFVAGAPGSKWSSVVKNIYYSPSIDRSDYRDEWTYYHDASGTMDLMHLGAYFDPGMACDLPENMNVLTKTQAEKLFDQPFSDRGVRIIKSHIFSYSENLTWLKQHWPDCAVVLVHRSNDSCLGWWVKCGHFDITYPNYAPYYKNLKEMAKIIKNQNQGIIDAWWKYRGRCPESNQQLAALLKLEPPPPQYQQTYAEHDIRVMVV